MNTYNMICTERGERGRGRRRERERVEREGEKEGERESRERGREGERERGRERRRERVGFYADEKYLCRSLNEKIQQFISLLLPSSEFADNVHAMTKFLQMPVTTTRTQHNSLKCKKIAATDMLQESCC